MIACHCGHAVAFDELLGEWTHDDGWEWLTQQVPYVPPPTGPLCDHPAPADPHDRRYWVKDHLRIMADGRKVQMPPGYWPSINDRAGAIAEPTEEDES